MMACPCYGSNPAKLTCIGFEMQKNVFYQIKDIVYKDVLDQINEQYVYLLIENSENKSLHKILYSLL